MFVEASNFTEISSHAVNATFSGPIMNSHYTSIDKRKSSTESALLSPVQPPKREKRDLFNKTTKSTRCYRHSSNSYASEYVETERSLNKKLKNFGKTEQEQITAVWDSFSSSSAESRLMMLEGIVNLSCVRQLSYLNQVVPKQLRIDFMASAPPEIGFNILSFLDAKSLCQAARVSKSWARLANDDLLWHRMCVQHIDKVCHKCGWGLPMLNSTNTAKYRNVNSPSANSSPNNLSTSPSQSQPMAEPSSSQLQNTCSPRTFNRTENNPHIANVSCSPTLENRRPEYKINRESSPVNIAIEPSNIRLHETPTKKSWKRVFAERQIVAKNWKLLRYSSSVMKGDDSEMLSQCSNDTFVIAAQKSGNINVFESSTGQILHVLKHGIQPVTSVTLNECIFISGSLDGSVKFWCYRAGRVVRTITPFPNEGVTALTTKDKRLVVGSISGNIAIFDFEIGRMYTLEGHTDRINGLMCWGDNYLFSCSDDSTIRRWDLTTRNCTHIYNGHSHSVRSVSLNISSFLSADSNPSKLTQKIFSASLDGTIRVWDIESGRCLSVLTYHGEPVWSLASDSFRLISAHNNGKICIWDSESLVLLHVLNASDSAINSVSLSDSGFQCGDSSGRMISFNFTPQAQ